MPDWQVYVRDSSLTRVGLVDDFQQLEATLRYNRTGAYALTLPATDAAAALLLEDRAGVIVVRDGVTLLSGPVTGRDRQFSQSADSLTVTGPTDDVWLDRRLSMPVPSATPVAAGTHYSGSAYDTRTGVASTVLRQYVDNNAGPSARPERAVPGLTLAADPLLGTSVTGRGRFQTLSELLRPLALAGGDLGFRVVQSGSSLEFQVYDPADLSASAIFSRGLGNLRSFGYTVEDPDGNYVLAAGGGEGTARIVVERGDSNSIVTYGRVEVFRDQRQTSVTAELGQAIDEELLERAGRTGLSMQPIDTDGLAFGRDYNLGDIVTVVVDGVPITDVLREVRFTLGPDGEDIAPAVGTPDGPRTSLALFQSLRRLGSRVSNIERR